MEFNFLSILFLALSILFLILTIYAFGQYKSKKRDSISLEEKITKLKENIKESEKNLKDLTTNYEEKESSLHHLLELEKQETELKQSIENKQSDLMKLEQETEEKANERNELDSELINIKNDISIFFPTLDLINVGFFEEPDYLFETSDRFKEEIKIVRELQKEMIKAKQAITIPDSVAVTSNSAYAKKSYKVK